MLENFYLCYIDNSKLFEWVEKNQLKEKNFEKAVTVKQLEEKIWKTTPDLFQIIFSLETPQHKIGWSLLSTVITSALAALYFSWDRLVVWWKKPIMEWMVEEKEEEE